MLRSRCAACRGKAAVDAVRVAVQYRTMVDRAESRGGPLMKKRNSDDTVIIKKYANRRLYNTETSSYITLEHLAAMTRERSEEHTSELQSLMRISYAVFCLKKQTQQQ